MDKKELIKLNLDKTNPNHNLPKVKLRLYVLKGIFKNKYFETKELLKEYCDKEDTSFYQLAAMDFFDEALGKEDVIRIITEDGKVEILSIIDNNTYEVYNNLESEIKEDFVWNIKEGNITDIYNEFKIRNITFKKAISKNKSINNIFNDDCDRLVFKDSESIKENNLQIKMIGKMN